MISFRAPIESDRRFVVATFLDSYKKQHYAGLIPYKLWWATMKPVAEDLLLDGEGISTLVAYVEGEDNTNVDDYGWITTRRGDPAEVVYVYVKGLYRGLGLARKLFKEAGVDPKKHFVYSASTKDCREIVEKGIIPKAEFDPQALRKECKQIKKKKPSPIIQYRKPRVF